MRVNRIVLLCCLVSILSAVLYAAVCGSFDPGADQASPFRTTSVKRGDLLSTISASGVVEPEEVIDVGAQVAGRIVAFGRDASGNAIDYGSVVEEGMVLARIDDAVYAADVATAKGQLDHTRSGVLRAEADLRQLQARLYQAERYWNRAENVGPARALSFTDYDAAKYAFEIARANVDVGKAAIAQAKDSVTQATAGLAKTQQNLDYCTIKSPVKGVIVDRRVNIGQTVVASLNAPSLFLIARDLRKLQVWISVNEADIGLVRPGQPVTFTVDAFPGQIYKGEVRKIRLNAVMTQNVVTFTVEVTADNSDSKLLPYLTANAKFLVHQRNNVLLVPNTALRWTPKPEQMAPGSAEHSDISPATDLREGNARALVWLSDGRFVKPCTVTTGPTDGTVTEIVSGEIQEGTEVVTGERHKKTSGRQASSNPFAPRFSTKGGGGGH